jgi:ribosome-binding protein aMBF1 (putative translation factor)
MQERLSDLARIIERRIEHRKEANDDWEYSETVSEVLSSLDKAREVRGNIVGQSLARIADHLPQQQPHVGLPEPIRPVNTARTVTQALAPPKEIGGGGFFSSAPKPTRMPSRPDDFPSDLWPRAIVILSELIQKFPNQKHLRELCEHAVPEMTPLYCEAVETGKMEPGAVLSDDSGMEELLRLLLAANDPGHSSWGISNQAWEILQGAKTATWGKLAQAIAEVQQRTANEMKRAPSVAPKTQSTGNIPGQFAGLPSWEVAELMQRRVEAAGRLRTEEKQKAQSPDPVLDAFNRRDTTVASERTPAQNNRKTTQTVEDKPTGDGAKARIGQNIEKLRKECGWSYDQLAGATGIDKKLVLSHTHRKHKPNPNTLRVYAQAFSKKLNRPITANNLEE